MKDSPEGGQVKDSPEGGQVKDSPEGGQVAGHSSRYALLDHVPLGVCVLSSELKVCFWNTCLESWTDIPRAELLGTDLSERFSHLRQPLYYQRLLMIFEGGPPTIFSSQLHRHLIPAPLPDGHMRIQHTVVTAIKAEDDGFDALLSIQDVTDLTRRLEEHRALRHQALREARERRRAEQEQRRLEAKIQSSQKFESLGVLAGGIAHDFNNLLVGILGNADLALSNETPSAPQREYLESIITAAQGAAKLSNQMLDFSGKGKFVTRVLDLRELVREVVHLLEMPLSKQARINFELPEQPLTVEADPAQIRQLVMNLITNAGDAVDDGGMITISGDTIECDHSYLSESYLMDDLPAGVYVHLDVADNGAGMSPETLDKVFDPFFTTKFAGRGLGLAAVLGIVRGHRGTVRVDSAPGRGTTFRVLLPASGQIRSVEARSEPEAVKRRGGETILVVDDEEAVRTVVQRVLEHYGFMVITASDGDEGIETFRHQSERIDLVLLDMTMPRLSGLETLRELRRIRGSVTVVLSSGYSEQEARDHFADQPISGFLQKPYSPSELLAAVQVALGDRTGAGKQVGV